MFYLGASMFNINFQEVDECQICSFSKKERICVCKYIFICNEKKNELICPASLVEEIG